MAGTYRTPGVYVEEISTFPPSVAQVQTAIPAFIGYTEKSETIKDTDDLAGVPHRITSLLEYESYFGGPENESITVVVSNPDTADNQAMMPVSASIASPSAFKMYYAVRHYFANGGGPCYILSVGKTSGGSVSHSTLSGNNGLGKIKEIDEVTLYLLPDMEGITNNDQYYGVYTTALQHCADLGDRFCVIDIRKGAGTPIPTFREKIGINNLKYGAAYWPHLQTSYNYQYADATVTFSQAVNADGGDNKFDTTTLANAKDSGHAEAAFFATNFTTAFEAELKNVINKLFVTLAPSAAVCGVYANVDSNRGVWKAPANVSLNNVVKPLELITDETQEDLNMPNDGGGKSVNAIRSFTGKGILVWGARTLAGNDNEWRYVPVRRFFNMVEESVKKATEQFVFEPNDANTWVKIKAMISNYLTTLWRQGALAGAKPEHAFRVSVGLNETMTAQDILEGKLVVEIAMAAVRPAEFIILRFMHKMQES
ncbi:MAG: phage tail sheath C-terminal domain-containing protein [Bacteroidota bacterium]